MNGPAVSIVVPTINRPEFVRRNLRFLDSVDFDRDRIHVIIGDSSSGEHLDAMIAVVEEFADRLHVRRLDCRNRNVEEATCDALDAAGTPYAAFAGDDDIQMPSGVLAAADFLDRHSDYASAAGQCMRMEVAGGAPYGTITRATLRRQPEEEAETARERFLRRIIDPIDTVYYVHRIDVLKTMHAGAKIGMKDDRIRASVWPRVFAVVCGKMKVLDTLQIVRQKHPQRISHGQGDELAWFAAEHWGESYRQLEAAVTKEMARRDGISVDEAGEVFRKGFICDTVLQMQRHYFEYGPVQKAVVTRALFRDGLPAIIGAELPRAQRKLLHEFDGRITKFDLSREQQRDFEVLRAVVAGGT